MVEQPSGTVTLVFTDIEGSTRLLGELGRDAYRDALAEHRRVVREACTRHAGYEVDCEGDSFFYAFASAAEAVAAVEEVMRELEGGRVRIRVGVHTGEPGLDPPKYVGMDVHRAARIMGVANGGQVLLSESTYGLVAVDARDLGLHRLKDMLVPQRLYQLGEARFPPLKTISNTNLPRPASSFVGRKREVAEVVSLLRSDARLLTLTGPGGSGKTRLALQAAAELNDHFTGGTYFVALAPLSDAAAVPATVAAALDLKPDEDVVERLRSSRALLVLDNAEHLRGVALEISKLRVGETALLVTSRAPLRLSGERELPLDPLQEDDAVELFISRAAERGRTVAPDEAARSICRRLDNLPLALELAAARLAVLGPIALLSRLDRALPLLAGGAHDVDERQRTLRATIEWSYRLLDSDTQRALRRLAIFRGGFTLDAAEAVAYADLDIVTGLVEQSLVRRVGDDRYVMLETIREFGLEEQDDGLALAHARYYVDLLASMEPELRTRTTESLALYRSESENIWAALDELVAAGRREEAWELATTLHFYWLTAGGIRRAAGWLQRELPKDRERATGWARAVLCLADLLDSLGEVDEAAAALDEVEPLALATNDAECLVELYRIRCTVARSRRDFSAAVEAASAELAHAPRVSERSEMLAQMHFASALFEAGELERAEAVALPLRGVMAGRGDVFSEAMTLHLLAEFALERGHHDAAAEYLDETIGYLRSVGTWSHLMTALTERGFYAMAAGRREDARLAFAQALDVTDTHDVEFELSDVIDHIAVVAASDDRAGAGSVYATVAARRAALGLPRRERDMRVYERLLGGEELVGEVIEWGDAVALARSLLEWNPD